MIKNGNSPVLNKCSIEDIVYMIRKLHVKMGIVNTPDDDDDGNSMLLEMIRTMKDVFGNWKIKHIEHAFDLGMSGTIQVDMNMYNKPFNLVFLSTLIKAYKEYTAKAIEDERRMNNVSADNKPSEEQQREIIIRNVRREFELYKRTRTVNNFGNAIYLSIKDRIYVDESELRPIAEELYKRELEKKIIKAEIERTFTVAMNESMSRAEKFNYNNDEELRIMRIMDDLKLKLFFSDMIDMDADVDSIL